jgi:hypothetical protein
MVCGGASDAVAAGSTCGSADDAVRGDKASAAAISATPTRLRACARTAIGGSVRIVVLMRRLFSRCFLAREPGATALNRRRDRVLVVRH